MTEDERYKEYLICQERGHVDSGKRLASNPPKYVCAKCGTYYHYSEPRLVEGNVPSGLVK